MATYKPPLKSKIETMTTEEYLAELQKFKPIEWRNQETIERGDDPTTFKIGNIYWCFGDDFYRKYSNPNKFKFKRVDISGLNNNPNKNVYGNIIDKKDVVEKWETKFSYSREGLTFFESNPTTDSWVNDLITPAASPEVQQPTDMSLKGGKSRKSKKSRKSRKSRKSKKSKKSRKSRK